VSEVNLDRLRELAGYLLGAVRELRELGRTRRDVFLADSRTVNGAKYLLIVATEAALDICNHIAARRGGRSPRDYADCLAVLREIAAVDENLAFTRPLLQQQQAEEGRLPGAAWTREKHELALADSQREVAKRVQTATVKFREMMRLDHAACAPGAKGVLKVGVKEL